MSPAAVRVKEEPEGAGADPAWGSRRAALRDHTYASKEYPPADVCVKTEPSCSASEWADLYAEHAVKAELVLGPECVQRPRARVAPGESSCPSESSAESARALVAGARPARKPRGSRRTLGGYSARLRRVPHRRVPPARARGSDRDRPARAHVDSDIEDELYTTVDYDKDPVCDMCGRRFALKADLMRHVVVHIHAPAGTEQGSAGTEQEQGSSGGEDDDLPRFLWRWARLVPRACRVRLERCDATRPPSAPRDAPPHTRETFLHNVENTYECDICKRRFTLKRHLNLHMTALHSPNISQVLHKRSHKTNGYYVCECKKEFLLLRNLLTHIRIHTGGKPRACDIVCIKRFDNDLNIYRRTHTGEKPFSCEICKEKFSQVGSLMKHKFIVHEGIFKYTHSPLKGTRPQSCASSPGLHIPGTHTGVKPYFCDVCKQRFTQSGDLMAHKRIHTEEKPFPCEICKKRFRKSNDTSMCRHRRIHTGEKPHCCKQCGKKFKRLYFLTQHIRNRTGEKPFNCETCSEHFFCYDALKSHKRIHVNKVKHKSGRPRKRRTSPFESCVSERDDMDRKDWNDEKTRDRDVLKKENCDDHKQEDDETNPRDTNGRELNMSSHINQVYLTLDEKQQTGGWEKL